MARNFIIATLAFGLAASPAVACERASVGNGTYGSVETNRSNDLSLGAEPNMPETSARQTVPAPARGGGPNPAIPGGRIVGAGVGGTGRSVLTRGNPALGEQVQKGNDAQIDAAKLRRR